MFTKIGHSIVFDASHGFQFAMSNLEEFYRDFGNSKAGDAEEYTTAGLHILNGICHIMNEDVHCNEKDEWTVPGTFEVSTTGNVDTKFSFDHAVCDEFGNTIVFYTYAKM